MMKKPTRAQMAADHRAKAAAAREAKLKDAERAAPFRRGGSNELMYGRIIVPGEMPSAAGPPSPRWPWEDGP